MQCIGLDLPKTFLFKLFCLFKLFNYIFTNGTTQLHNNQLFIRIKFEIYLKRKKENHLGNEQSKK